MADNKMNQNESNEQLRSQANQSDSNQTMRHEQAKGQVSGQRDEKSAIGGGQQSSQTGEPGRARNELDQERGQQGGQDTDHSEPTGEKSEFDKSRSETAGSR